MSADSTVQPGNDVASRDTSDIGKACLAGRRITLCVTGSIAAYKAVDLVRLLTKQGAHVQVVMTRSAAQFVGAALFSGITGRPALCEMFGGFAAGESHVPLGTDSDLIIIAPATADILARLAQGRADDLVTATALCARCKIVVAPAMHPAMWEHPATQRNVDQLRRDRRVNIVGPDFGEVASGETGVGRLASVEHILYRSCALLSRQDLAGRHVVISAGPTLEDLDPVRFLGNRSSGKMGFAVAQSAARRGARVTLVAGPTFLATPFDVERVDVRSASDMREALWAALGSDLQHADALVMAAAVGDYHVRHPQSQKIRRNAEGCTLELAANPDILAEIGSHRSKSLPVLVGFAVETDTVTLVESARRKLLAKGVDLVVANLAADAFGRDDNRATLVSASADVPIAMSSKGELANHILQWVAESLGAMA
jgi:phosphopantothenoylcysteine decarboxylase/phosphopantothenate--cysteine ligase